jgi:hypothetical protein
MIFLLVTIFIFFIFASSHIFLHKFLVARGAVTFHSIWIHGFGFLVSGAVIYTLLISKYGQQERFSDWITLSLPLTSLVMYLLAAVIQAIFFTGPYLSDEAPSAKILTTLSVNKRMSEREIQNMFSNRVLVLKRIDDLYKGQMIVRKKGKLLMTDKGNNTATVLETYRNILGWGKGG